MHAYSAQIRILNAVCITVRWIYKPTTYSVCIHYVEYVPRIPYADYITKFCEVCSGHYMYVLYCVDLFKYTHQNQNNKVLEFHTHIKISHTYLYLYILSIRSI